jgi:cellulose synthase/poly-beta-1,6-N-acetylglucosamine synthase-like glycosyltransferase
MSAGSSLSPAEVIYALVLVFGFLALLASVYSLYLGLEFDRKVSLSLTRPNRSFCPHVCLIMPCKGVEPGLGRNIEAIFEQTYDNYHMITVTDTAQDPAYDVAKSALARHPKAAAHLYTSEASVASSGKVAALLTALAKDRGRAEVYAFIDSDALVPPRWLGDLVDPLKEESIGATTGFRWYFPSRGGFWSYVEAAWNASGTNLLFDHRYNFPWGGAMAIRAETLEKVDIEHVWSNALSDDLTLNSALRKHGYRTAFLPQCTVATFNHTNMQGFLKWATRQTALTKVFNARLWKYAMAAYAFFDFTFLLGVLSAAMGALAAPVWFVPSALLLTPSALGILRSTQRNSIFSRAMPEFKQEFKRTRLAVAIASLIVPWIMTYCIIKSARTHEIEWRGRVYKLRK